MKPDPRIYNKALEELDLRAENVIFVGDGDCDELGGAQRVGITPVLVTNVGVNDAFKIAKDRDTTELKVDSLFEIFDIL